jgi:hypothetical protein
MPRGADRAPGHLRARGDREQALMITDDVGWRHRRLALVGVAALLGALAVYQWRA